MNPFRILSLDGGGIRGAFSAAVLARLEEQTGRSVVDHFDLITGTSTGGIIALGLALGLPAAQIREFYRTHGADIFPNTGFVQRWSALLRQLFAPKRSRARLEAALRAVFGNRKVSEARCRLVLPTYDAVAGRIYLLKTAHLMPPPPEQEAEAVHWALATSAAPTYFPASSFPLHPGVSYVDGGVWANNPVMVGLVEAVHFLGQRPEQLDILSIGTVSEPFSISQGRRQGGILSWNAALINLFMRGQAEAALVQAQLLTGKRVHRIDVQVSPGRFSLDDSRAVEDLVALGEGEARKQSHLSVVGQRFLNGVRTERFDSLGLAQAG